MSASKDYLYIDCTSNGLGKRPSVPIFNGKKICLQAISQCQQVYSAAALGAVEARFSDNDEVSMVFCYQNCSDLLWEKLLKFEAYGREFANFLRSVEQFFQTVKGQNNFW